MLRIVLTMLLPGVILGAAVEKGCWASRHNGQPPPNPDASITLPAEPELYGVVKAVDATQGTITLSSETDGEKQEKSYQLTPDASVLNLDGPSKLADLSAGTRVGVVFDADHKVVAEVRAEPFLILVKPKQNQVEVNKPFDVELRVVNASPSPQSFCVMSCSWYDNWKSSNPRVSSIGWACYRNGPTPIKLAPGEAYEKVLPMQAKAVGPLSFRMGFNPEEEYKGQFPIRRGKRTYWSAEVTLEVRQGQNN